MCEPSLLFCKSRQQGLLQSRYEGFIALRAVQVRELDTAQSRIHATLARINIVVDRTAAINGVRAALDMEDYEAAARHVKAFLALEQRFGPIHDEHDSKQAQEQRRVRHTCFAHRAASEDTCQAYCMLYPRTC